MLDVEWKMNGIFDTKLKCFNGVFFKWKFIESANNTVEQRFSGLIGDDGVLDKAKFG